MHSYENEKKIKWPTVHKKRRDCPCVFLTMGLCIFIYHVFGFRAGFDPVFILPQERRCMQQSGYSPLYFVPEREHHYRHDTRQYDVDPGARADHLTNQNTADDRNTTTRRRQNHTTDCRHQQHTERGGAEQYRDKWGTDRG